MSKRQTYFPPLGGGVTRQTVPTISPVGSGATLAVTTYPGGAPQVDSTNAQTFQLSSGNLTNLGIGCIIRAHGFARVSSTGTPSVVYSLARDAGTTLAQVVVDTNGWSNMSVQFDFESILTNAGTQGLTMKAFAVIEDGTVESSDRFNTIWAGNIYPLFVSTQWSVADAANISTIINCSWEVTYPLVVS